MPMVLCFWPWEDHTRQPVPSLSIKKEKNRSRKSSVHHRQTTMLYIFDIVYCTIGPPTATHFHHMPTHWLPLLSELVRVQADLLLIQDQRSALSSNQPEASEQRKDPGNLSDFTSLTLMLVMGLFHHHKVFQIGALKMATWLQRLLSGTEVRAINQSSSYTLLFLPLFCFYCIYQLQIIKRL